MIYLTQLVYIKEGQEEVFFQFENLALPIIARYGGELLLRVRPTADNYIEGSMELPFEIHLVSFNTEDDFRQFQQDEQRKQFLYLKEQSIRSVILLQSNGRL